MLVDVVIENLDYPGVPHAICRVPLPLEPGELHLRERCPAVQHLHRHPALVAVVRLVHRAHPSDADQPLDAPLPKQHRADPRLGLLREVVCGAHTTEASIPARRGRQAPKAAHSRSVSRWASHRCRDRDGFRVRVISSGRGSGKRERPPGAGGGLRRSEARL